jgi:RNA polymerase sigma-70 factor (sigma-E family)
MRATIRGSHLVDAGVAASTGEHGHPPEQFEDFVLRCGRDLQRRAWLLAGDWQAAEDLVQTALLRIWPTWSRIAGLRDPDAYVRRALMNAFLSEKRLRRSSEVPIARAPDRPGADAAELSDTRDVVVTALRALPPRQRAVVVLRYFDDLTEAQVAAALGCRVGTVKGYHSRALTALRRDPRFDSLLQEVPQ